MRKAAETAMQPGKVKLMDQVRQRTRTLHLPIGGATGASHRS